MQGPESSNGGQMNVDVRDQKVDVSAQPPDPLTRLLAVVEIMVVSLTGFVLLPVVMALFGITEAQVLTDPYLLVILLLSEASITLALIGVILQVRGEGISSVGLVKCSLKKEFLIGGAVLPLLFLLTLMVRLLFGALFPGMVTQTNPILQMINTPGALILFLFSSIYVGGFKEEVQRAFVLSRFKRYLGGIWLGLFLWSIVFGAGHVVQGIDNAVGAGLLGLAFGVVYIWRGSLVAAIVSHALYDVVTLIVFYSFILENVS